MRDRTSSGVNFSYSFEKRLNELENGFELDYLFTQNLNAFFVEMNYRYPDKNLKFNEHSFWPSIKEEFVNLVNKTRLQPGKALSIFFYLEDLWLRIDEIDKNYKKMDLLSFLSLPNHLLYPMKLIRPGEKYLDEVTSPRFISCLYVVDYKNDLIVSPFEDDEIHKVWFNRIKHSTLANFNNVFAAGVMYFCPSTKELLYVNNASGHYRLKDAESCKEIKEPLTLLGVKFDNCQYSHYSDVEFMNSYKLIE